MGYSGNLGRAHEFDAILDAIDAFCDEADVVFLFIGGKQLEADRGVQKNPSRIGVDIWRDY